MSVLNRIATVVSLFVCVAVIAAPPERVTPVKGPVAKIRAAVANGGTSRIIVGLHVPGYAPEGRLNSSQIAKQRQNIHAVQQAVLHRHPDVRVAPGHLYQSLPAMAVDVDANGFQQLLDDHDVASVEENVAMVPALRDTTTLIGMPSVWTAGYDGTGWAVAIFDTGVLSGHHFFGGRVSWEGCFSSSVPASPTSYPYASLCPDGQNVEIGGNSGEPCPWIECDHGTEVAGVAAGHDSAAPGGELSGVARGASIMSFMVKSLACADSPCNPSSIQNVGVFQSADLIAALDYISSAFGQTPNPFAHLAAVNLSFTTDGGNFVERYGADCFTDPSPCNCHFPTLTDAVASVESQGIAVVAATGNNGTTTSLPVPPCVPGVVAVAGVTKGDQYWVRSNFSPEIDLLAPAAGYSNTSPPTDGIFMGIPYTNFPTDYSNITYDPTAYGQSICCNGDGSQAWRVGTSFAAPHVTGAFAVLRQIAPDLPLSSLVNDLKNSGALIATPNSTYTPRVNVAAAVTLAQDRTAPAPPTNLVAQGSSSGVINLTWSASTDASGIWKYRIYRRDHVTDSFANVGESTSTSWSETRSPGIATQYYVTAVDRASNESLQSAADVAVTASFSNEPLVADSTRVFGAHIAELRQCVDAWRVFANYSRIWPTYTPLTGTIHPTDVTDLINYVNPALSAAGVSPFSYHARANGDPVPMPATGVRILTDHVEQLRAALE